MQKELFKSRMGPPPRPSDLNTQSNSHDFSPDEWQNFFDTMEDVTIPGTKDTFRLYIKGTQGVVFLFLHGGGHSALSWALTVQRMDSKDCRLVAYDCRAHGKTQTEDEKDLSAERLTKDCLELIETRFPEDKIVLVGHSMGGAIAARAAASGKIKKLCALVVLDVVEEIALGSLSFMQGILNKRPTSFSSLEEAIQWSVASGNLQRIESARISIPPQLVTRDEKYVWRTDLPSSEPFWQGWFIGLSKTFLSARCTKVLILAGTDRLDRDLTAAHMQGKYQLILLPQCGHVIQEDDPLKTATSLMQIKDRYQL